MAGTKLKGLLFSKERTMDVSAPSPPTGKEMIEDLENCSRNDPVIKVGDLIQEKVKAMSMDGAVPLDSSHQLLRNDHNISKRMSEPMDNESSSASATPLWELLDISSLAVFKKMSSKSGNSTGVLKQQPGSPPPENIDSVFERLKKLTGECEKAQEIIEILEPELKTLKSDTSEFRKTLSEDLDK